MNVIECIAEACKQAEFSSKIAQESVVAINKAIEKSKHKGIWSADNIYNLNETVSHNKIIYISNKNNNTDEPGNNNSWTQITQYYPLDPTLFGAKADGTTNDTNALALALNIGWVDGVNRTYKIDEKLKLTQDTILSNCVLDFSAIDPGAYSSQEGVFEVTGNIDIDVAIVEEDVNINSVSLKIDSNVSVGDIIMIKTANKWDLFGEVDSNFVCRVVSKDDDTIYIDKSAPFIIPKNSTIDIIKPIKLFLNNVEIIGSVADKNIAAVKGKYVEANIKNCKINGFGYMAVEIINSYAPVIENCKLYDAHYDGLSYGVGITNCFAPKIRDITGGDMRHLVTVGGTSGITTECLVENIVGTCREAVIDSHSACNKMTIKNSECNHSFDDDDSAIVFQGKELIVENTKASSNSGEALLFQPLVTNAKLTAKNNTFDSSVSVALSIQIRSNTHLCVEGNVIKGATENKTLYIKAFEEGKEVTGIIASNNIYVKTNQAGIFAQNSMFLDVKIVDNTIEGGDYGIYLQGSADDAQVENTIIESNIIKNADIGIRLHNCKNSLLINNVNIANNNDTNFSGTNTNCKQQLLALLDI